MKPTVRTALILVVVAVALIGIKVAMTVASHPSDETLIQQALEQSLDDSRNGRPGGVLDLLSQQLKVDQQTAPAASQIADFIKRTRPDVTLADRHALVTGDEARIETPADLSLLGQSFHLNKVTLVFHKEEARGFLLLPTTKWRLTEVRLPEDQLPNLSG